MKRLVIIAHGDNIKLHGKALDAAIEAIEAVNHAPVVASWVEEMTPDETVAALHA